jgi:hypothetical protein
MDWYACVPRFDSGRSRLPADSGQAGVVDADQLHVSQAIQDSGVVAPRDPSNIASRTISLVFQPGYTL